MAALSAIGYPAPSLRQYSVSVDDLCYPEYCFRIHVDFNRKFKDDPGTNDLKRILVGLLNTSGGVLEVCSIRQYGTPELHILDKWKLYLEESLVNFIPHRVLKSCVYLEDINQGTCIILVKKSPVFITFNTNMYTSWLAGSRLVIHDGVYDVMFQRSMKPFQDPFVNKAQMRYGDVINIHESRCLEFKYWSSNSLEVLKTRIQDPRTEKAMFCFPNSPQGGCLVLGIREDQNLCTVIGQILAEEDEMEFVEFIEEFLVMDFQQNHRIWSEVGKTPVRGQDWDIRFIPVERGPPSERLRVIVLNFKHFPGGVFIKCPESYLVSQDGNLHQMTFSEWKAQIEGSSDSGLMLSQNFSKVSLSDKGMQSSINTATSQSIPPEHAKRERVKFDVEDRTKKLKLGVKTNNESKTPVSLPNYADESTQNTAVDTVTPMEIDSDAETSSAEVLSWTKHKQNWDSNLDDHGSNIEKQAPQIAGSSSIFSMKHPANWTPSRASVIASQRDKHSVIEAIKEIERSMGNHPSFCLASSSWTKNVLLVSDISCPAHHVMDVIVVDETGAIKFWAIVGRDARNEDVWKYVFLSARVTKKTLMKCCQLKESGFVAHMWLDCHVFKLGQGRMPRPSPWYQERIIPEWFSTPLVSDHMIKLSLTRLLLKKENTRFLSLLYDDFSVCMFSKQAEIILDFGLEKFNYIEGPPGSGKTFITLQLYLEMQNCGFAVSTRTFANFLMFQGVSGSIFVLEGKCDLGEVINNITNKNIKFLIVDDVQNFRLPEDEWYRLFKHVAQTALKLIVLGDSQYQTYQETPTLWPGIMSRFCKDNHCPVMIKSLSVIHRNTRKVVSFMKSVFSRECSIQELSCSRLEDGDDIEIRHIRSPEALCDFIVSLVDLSGVLANRAMSYEPKDIAVLTGDAECAKNLRDHLQKYLRARDSLQSDVHDGAKFPVTGYTVDTLDNFVGIDRRVCVFVTDGLTPTSTDKKGQSLANPRYRTFIASRAISRVVFVVSTPITGALAKEFKLNNFPMAYVTQHCDKDALPSSASDHATANSAIPSPSRLVPHLTQHVVSPDDLTGAGHRFKKASHHATARPSPSTMVPHLGQCIVSPNNLTCADYCFRTYVNFNQKLKDDQGVTHLKQILTALLNTSGGVIEIHSKDGVQPTEDTLDRWRCNLEDVLTTFVSEHIKLRCVHFSLTYPLMLYVAKSDQLITMRSGLFVRGLAGTKQVNDVDSIQEILSRKSQQQIPIPLHVNQNVRYGDTVTTPEGPNVEYKYWKAAKDLRDIKERLQDERTSKILFSLPNMPQGGYIVLGVEEDKKSGNNKIRGQVISEDEEEQLAAFLETHFQQSSSGQPRLWGHGSRAPERGRDWEIKFIKVENKPLEHLKERRRVILIEFWHFPGGVFQDLPETYSVAETGEVHSLLPESWRLAVTASYTTMATQYAREPLDILSKMPNTTTNTQGLPSSKSKDPTSNTSTAGPNQGVSRDSEEILKVRESISWTKHGSHWNEQLEKTSLDLMKNVDKLASQSRIFQMTTPINFTPCRKTLLDVTGSSLKNMKNAIIHVEATHESCKAFAIATSTWPLILKSEHLLEKPQGHIFDVFAVDETGEILLWAIVDDKTCQINTVWKYLYLSGRLTKRNMLCGPQYKTRFINSIQVKTRVYILGRGEATPPTSGRLLADPLPVPRDKVTEMKICLATAVLEKNTRIKSIFGDENSFVLTAQQIETILFMGLQRFNYIEGPPGSGKTHMAMFLCQQYGNYGYICTTEALKNFLIYQGLQMNRVFVVRNDAELTQLVDQNCFLLKSHLIFDDFQQKQFLPSTWEKLFEYIRLSESTSLVVFGDSVYHNYQHSRNMLSEYMTFYCRKNAIHLNQTTLSDVHRNTRKVTAFIKSTIAKDSDFSGHSLISCSNTENGDDVEVRRFSHIWADSDDNSFIDFIQQLIDPMKVLENQSGSYEARDVVILLDTQNVDSDVKRLGAIATKHLENIDVHDAANFPVTGLTIDSLDNFVGMDRRVCILVSSREILLSDSSSGHSINNPRYRAFVASRGISKVVFAVEEPLTTSLTEALNFGELNLGVTELWHLEKGELIFELCFIAVDGTLAILYISPRDSRICVVSTDGEPLPVSVDSAGVRFPFCTASSRDGRRVVIAGCNSTATGNYTCGVYEVRPGRVARVCNITTDSRAWSVSWTRDGDVIILLGKPGHPRDVARVSPTDGRVLWRLDSSVTHLRRAVRLSVNPRTDAILVCDGDCVRELSDQGQHIRDISLSSGVDPEALCVDSSGRLMFLGDCCDADEGSPMRRDIYLHNTSLGYTTKVVQAPGVIYNTRLHDDRYLGVATEDGIVMYDVSALF